MAVQTVFSSNLNPSTANLSSRFTDAVAFYIAAPLITVELEIDVFLQVYFPAIIGEQVRNIPLGKISEQSILLNVSDTETANIIPNEFLDTGLEMALLFLTSDTTFLQAAVIKKNCSMTFMCQSLETITSRLDAIENALSAIAPIVNSSVPTTQQQSFFFLQ